PFEPGRLELAMESLPALVPASGNHITCRGQGCRHFRRSRADPSESCFCPIGQMTLTPPALKPRGPAQTHARSCFPQLIVVRRPSVNPVKKLQPVRPTPLSGRLPPPAS